MFFSNWVWEVITCLICVEVIKQNKKKIMAQLQKQRSKALTQITRRSLDKLSYSLGAASKILNINYFNIWPFFFWWRRGGVLTIFIVCILSPKGWQNKIRQDMYGANDGFAHGAPTHACITLCKHNVGGGLRLKFLVYLFQSVLAKFYCYHICVILCDIIKV